MHPKVSVLIPVYNTERYLRECLDSVVSQTLKEIEIICINDGSTDSSLSILREYAEKDSRIRILDKPNTGYGDSMNRGLDAASGEYIGIVESDDFIEPDMYETLYTTARDFHTDWVAADFHNFASDGILFPEESNRFVQDPALYCQKFSGKQVWQILSSKEGDLAYWSGIYRLEFIRENKIRYNPTPGASFQDCGFLYKTIYCQPEAILLHGSFYHYRRDNPNSSMHSKEKTLCIHDEFFSIYEFTRNNPERQTAFSPFISCTLIRHYLLHYKNLTGKSRLTFLRAISGDFKLFEKNGFFSMNVLSRQDRFRCCLIRFSPLFFLLVSNLWNTVRPGHSRKKVGVF